MSTPPGAPARALRAFRARRSSVLWWLLVERQKPWLVASGILSVAATVISIGVAQLTATIFDEAITEQSQELRPLVLALVGLAVLDAVVLLANLQVSSRIEYQIEYDLRNRLYDRLQRAAPRDLDAVATGQVVTRSLSDLELVQLLLQVIPLVVAGVPILLGYAIYLAFVNLPLTLLVVSLFAINGAIIERVRLRLWGLAFLNLNSRAEVATAVDEPVRGIRVVKAFGAENRERSRVGAAAAAAYGFALTRARLEARFDLLLRAAPVLVRAGLLLFGARLVVDGSISLGKFVIFYTFLVEGTYIAQYLDELVSLWQMARTGAGRITQLLAVAAEIVPGPVVPFPDPSSGLEFHRVGVGFGDATVLCDFDLAIRPGQMTVLSGGPGSGKSTVAALAAGLVPVSEGEVRLDGVDIRRLDPDLLHRAVHSVGEDPFLFARTVRENLSVGSMAGGVDGGDDVDDDRLWATLDAAGATNVINDLVGGLDEVLGDRGMTLSGGQRQRLALARALVVPPRVLVLDEALSAVNPGLEVEILRSIRRHHPSMAILCITRRPGPRTLADAVVELPPAGSHRAVAAPGEVDVPEVTLFASLVSARLYDPRLAPILSKIEPSRDRPELPDEVATRSEEVLRLMSMLRPQRSRVLQAMACLLVLTGVGLIPEFAFGEAADFVREGDTRSTDRLAMGLLAVAFVVGASVYGFRITSAKVNQNVLYGLRRRVFERLSRLGVDYFDRELPGRVSARVVHDIDVIGRFLGSGFGEPGFYQLVSNVALFAGAMAIMVLLSPTVAMVAAPFVLVVAAATIGQIGVADRAFAVSRARLGEVVARLQEDLAGRYVIRAFGAEGEARSDFDEKAWSLRQARRWAATVSNVYIVVIQLTLALGAAAVYARAGGLVLAGAMTVGTVISLRLYLDSALRPIRLLGRLWQEYVQARVSGRQLAEPFSVPVLPMVKPDAPLCPRLRGEVTVESVSFTYPGTPRPVVHDLSIDIDGGGVVALVGSTGAGKSSVAKLLGRIYDPTAGRILVDGLDLRDLELTSYRRRLGVVPQDAFVFRGTLASNIAYGRPDATPAEIEKAAAGVGALDALLCLEAGLEATVEEEGRNLSVAQRQLLALARMWLVEPDILVLDEATASLGAELEEAVLDAVTRLGRTTLLVTHRLAVAERADEVVVMADGRVVERGGHCDLLAAGGHYTALWTSTGQVHDPRI